MDNSKERQYGQVSRHCVGMNTFKIALCQEALYEVEPNKEELLCSWSSRLCRLTGPERIAPT